MGSSRDRSNCFRGRRSSFILAFLSVLSVPANEPFAASLLQKGKASDSGKAKAGDTVPPRPVTKPAAMPAGLKILDPVFEDYDGFPSPTLQVKAGGEAVLSFRAEGFERREGKNEAGLPEYHVKLSYEVELRDPKGVSVDAAKHGDIEQTLGPQDDQWRPLVRWSAIIPEWAPSGSYPIRIRLRDELGDQQSEQTVTLQVRGQNIPASDTFQAQQVEFARSDDGPWSPARYFALHDPIFVRFKIVGFKVSDQNQVSVTQDWAVLNSDGKVLVETQDAVHDESESIYPPRFLATNFRLELQDPKPGSYTLRITLRDSVGEQSTTVDAPFTLRP